ncbi:MAG TPA: hypothetical protein DIU14_07490 [Actinobacteria bacterium]|nr:hypothetical protein [Actinomycetota bacterium]
MAEPNEGTPFVEEDAPQTAVPPPGPATLIVDPAVRGQLDVVREGLRAIGLEHRVLESNGPDDAAALTRRALRDGDVFPVAVGGDRAITAVVNGFLSADRAINSDAVMAAVSAGAGSDFVRSFGLPDEAEKAVPRLAFGGVYRIDVIKVTCQDTRPFYVPNIAQVGLGGGAAHKAARLRFLGSAAAFAGFWLTMASYRRPMVKLAGDRREFEGRITNIVVANLQWFGHGILVAPRAWPEDGYMDVQVYQGPKSDAFTLLPTMFQGEHLPNPNILELRSKRLTVDAERPLVVEADGRVLGRTPATFEIVPQVLPLKV